MENKIKLSVFCLIDWIFSLTMLEAIIMYLIFHALVKIGGDTRLAYLSLAPLIIKLIDWLSIGFTYKIEINFPFIVINNKQINLSQLENNYNIYKVLCSTYSRGGPIYHDYLYKFEFKKQDGEIVTLNVGFFTYNVLKKILLQIGLFPQYTFKPFNKFVMTIILSLMFFGIGFLTYIQKPAPKLDSNAKEYMKHLEAGYKLFQNNDCKNALVEYEKAQKLISDDSELYLMKAYCYKDQKDYINALKEITTAENLYKKGVKSTYAQAKNFIFFDDKSSIYDTKGKIDYNLSNYNEAVSDFTEEINSTSYKYTRSYFWRGCSKFYNNDKQGAQADFIKHKEIINSCLNHKAEDQITCQEYKTEDLVKIEKWIKATL